MKVRITNEDGKRWYYKGEVYDVAESLNSCVYNLEKGYGSILKEHCEIISEKYTYAEVDLPEWWDGRPIKGYAWNHINDKECVWCIGKSKGNRFIGQSICGSLRFFNYFEPITETPNKAKVSITKDGKTREVALTDEQVKELGL